MAVSFGRKGARNNSFPPLAEWVLHPQCGSYFVIAPDRMNAETESDLLQGVGGPTSAALDRLIYCVGSARGGTSISFEIIGLHDNVISLGGPSHFLNHVWRYRRKVHERLWRQLLWTPSNVRHTEVRESLPEERRKAYLRLVNWCVAAKNLASLYKLYPLTRALDPEETRDPSSFVAWLDKGNDFWGVSLLPRAFPKGRFVQVVRDPRAAAASLSVRAAGRRVNTDFAAEPRDVIEAAIYWRNLVRRQRRFAERYYDRSVFFRFEDLTQRPLAIARALFDFLGLPPMADDALQKRLDGLVYSASLSGEQGHGISTAPNERWRTRLDALAVDLVTEICRDGARCFGYDLPPPSRRRGWLGIARLVPGFRGKAITLAKLAFLAIVDRPMAPGRTPVRLRQLTVGAGS